MERERGGMPPQAKKEFSIEGLAEKVQEMSTACAAETGFSFSQDDMARVLQDAKVQADSILKNGFELNIDSVIRGAVGTMIREKGADRYYSDYLAFFETHTKVGSRDLHGRDFFLKSVTSKGELRPGTSGKSSESSPMTIMSHLKAINERGILEGVHVKHSNVLGNEIHDENEYRVVGFCYDGVVLLKNVVSGKKDQMYSPLNLQVVSK